VLKRYFGLDIRVLKIEYPLSIVILIEAQRKEESVSLGREMLISAHVRQTFCVTQGDGSDNQKPATN